MRLRAARLSFGSVRAVELRLTLLVFLADRCHRMLGARRIWLGVAGCSVGLPQPRFRSLPRYRFAFVFLCVIIAGQILGNSELLIIQLC